MTCDKWELQQLEIDFIMKSSDKLTKDTCSLIFDQEIAFSGTQAVYPKLSVKKQLNGGFHEILHATQSQITRKCDSINSTAYSN